MTEEQLMEQVNVLERRVGKLQHGLIVALNTLEYVQKGVIQPDGGAVIKAMEGIKAELWTDGYLLKP